MGDTFSFQGKTFLLDNTFSLDKMKGVVPKKSPGFLFFFIILGCSHLNQKIDHLSFHTSKSEVLDILGRPFKIERKTGLDYWIYKFKIKDMEYTRALVFKEGHFLRANSIQPYPSHEILLEEVENLDQYRKALKEIKERRRKFHKSE